MFALLPEVSERREQLTRCGYQVEEVTEAWILFQGRVATPYSLC